MARARDVQDTGSSTGLLRANLTIARAVDLEDVLRHIVSAARELVNANYAALGVVRDGRLVRFCTRHDEDTVTQIGTLPEGKGLLGRLVDYPQPLRLADIGAHVSGRISGTSSADAFVPRRPHPGRRTCLRQPLPDGKQNAAEFSADDQSLSAVAAAPAIDNARLSTRSAGPDGRPHSWRSPPIPRAPTPALPTSSIKRSSALAASERASVFPSTRRRWT
jgi:hypothetical protein